MRFLVAVSSQEYSEQTLRIGSSVASAFGADLSIVYVGPKPREILAGGVRLAHDALLNWQINHPGVDVLLWAHGKLKEYQFIDTSIDHFEPTNLVEDMDRVRVILPHVHGEKIRLILREGEVMDQLKRETEYRDYLLTIVGGGQKKRLTRQLVQFVDTSLMFVKNFTPDFNYRFLLCVDDSRATRRAVVFCARVAAYLQAHVDILTVSKTRHFGEGYRGASEWAHRYMTRLKIEHTQHFETGDPSTIFSEKAGTDHIIIMGKSKKNPLLNFLWGTKPGDTVIKANCPTILVK